jgi:hypothetical protein
VKKPPRPTHSYLTETELRTLDVLVRRGARTLRPEECNKLISLFQHHVGDLQQARRSTAGMRAERGSLRRRAEDGEAKVAELATVLATVEGELAAAEARLDAVRKFANELATYCSPHGVAALYADRLQEVLAGREITR